MSGSCLSSELETTCWSAGSRSRCPLHFLKVLTSAALQALALNNEGERHSIGSTRKAVHRWTTVSYRVDDEVQACGLTEKKRGLTEAWCHRPCESCAFRTFASRFLVGSIRFWHRETCQSGRSKCYHDILMLYVLLLCGHQRTRWIFFCSATQTTALDGGLTIAGRRQWKCCNAN